MNLNSLIIILCRILGVKTIPISYAEEITGPLYNKTIKSIMSIYSHISKKDIQKIIVFKSISAAPIPTINTINNVPNFKSPLENFWHGGLEYVYPEDRGLSNSIEISEKLFSEVK